MLPAHTGCCAPTFCRTFQAGLGIDHARRVLGLEPGEEATPSTLRQRFLQRAIRVHPDKNSRPGAAEAFAELKDAYDALLRRAVGDAAARAAAVQSDAALGVLLRAMSGALRGEALEVELAALGVHRPPAGFGLVSGVRFDARLPACSSEDDGEGEQLGGGAGQGRRASEGEPRVSGAVMRALRDVFAEAGVPWSEGDEPVPAAEADEHW